MKERQAIALKMREEGKTFKQIGNEFKVSPCRAREIYRQAVMIVNNPGAFPGSVRAYNCIRNAGVDCENVDEIKKAISNMVIHPSAKIKNFGWKTYRELCAAVGVMPIEEVKERCPCCGQVVPIRSQGQK